MATKKSEYRTSTLSIKRKQTKPFSPVPTREEIEKATREFLAKGGKITRVEPEWIEEGRLYISG
ncbi:MAG: hypothetical protein MJE63_22100 [Proteobacteria bacterium]|nr:hypothetical protein [Pseudomonadota bacterium]